MPDPQTAQRQTVASLIAELSAYPPGRRVVFIDPDTGWTAPVVIREPDHSNPFPEDDLCPEDAGALVVTGAPYDRM